MAEPTRHIVSVEIDVDALDDTAAAEKAWAIMGDLHERDERVNGVRVLEVH